MTIDIVLATYNGAAYLAQQLDSILAQDETDWRLLVRDDSSKDTTGAILSEYAQRYPDKILLIKNDGKRLGITENFNALLTAATAEYVMCADQDDVWLPQKVSLTLKGMKRMEQQFGADMPLLVHTDSIVVDEVLNELAKSRGGKLKLNPDNSPLSRLLVQNTVQGCTMMMNRPLLSQALPIPPSVRMYDMWIAQVAAALGQIGYIEQATVKYRQHRGNAVGAAGGKKTLREKVGHIQHMMEANVTQAVLLLDRLGDRLNDENTALLKAFSKILDQGFIARRRILSDNKILREPAWQNIPLMLFV